MKKVMQTIFSAIIDKKTIIFYISSSCTTGLLSILWAHLFGSVYQAGNNALCDYLMWILCLAIPTFIVIGASWLIAYAIRTFKHLNTYIPRYSLFICFTGATLFSIGYCLSRVKTANDSLFVQGYLTIFGIVSALYVIYSLNKWLSKKEENE